MDFFLIDYVATGYGMSKYLNDRCFTASVFRKTSQETGVLYLHRSLSISLSAFCFFGVLECKQTTGIVSNGIGDESNA